MGDQRRRGGVDHSDAVPGAGGGAGGDGVSAATRAFETCSVGRRQHHVGFWLLPPDVTYCP